MIDFINKHMKDPPRGRVLPIEIPNVGRDDLAELFREMGFKRGAEIGVEKGIFSEVICRANPGVELHCVDLWRSYPGYKESSKDMEKNCEEACRRLKPYNCRIMRMSSSIAATQFQDGSLDFVYIDAAHDLPHVIEDIHAWTKKVRIGGIIAGHDYRLIRRFRVRGQPVRNTTHHVVQAVKAYTWAYDIRPWFVLGRTEKIPGETRDKDRSWMWIRTI